MLASCETRTGPTLKLTDAEGKSLVLPTTADVTIAEGLPDRNYQQGGVAQWLIVSSPDGVRSLIAFDPVDASQWNHAVLTIPVDASRWKLEGQMSLGVSPLEAPWKESAVTWNDAPAFERETKATAAVDATTTTVTVDVTSLLTKMQHGFAVFCHSADGKAAKPLRHMYQIMARHVAQSREHGFEGTAVESLYDETWRKKHLELFAPLNKGGLILFGGHGSGTVSCLVNIDDLNQLKIGPSIVLNGTCFGAATHHLVLWGDAGEPHRLLRSIAPKDSFALQMLRRGSFGYIGGSASCSFGHVEPAISLLRDEHRSLGQAFQAIQNGIIESVSVEHWDAGGVQPGDPGFPEVDPKLGHPHPTLIQYTIRTICLGDPAFVPYPKPDTR